MKIHILGSGSKGNAIVLETDHTRVLVDAGFGTRTLAQRMRALDVAPESISALVITHEHGDHICGAASAARKWRWPVYATPGTLRALRQRRHIAAHPIEPRRELVVDDLSLRFVRTPHDAEESIALVATDLESGIRTGVVYDLGHVTPRLAAHFTQLDALLLESNHDDDMLREGPYPWVVKQRIAGPRGHLSNGDAAVLARSCVHRGLGHLILCHLSQNNNRPEVALRTMRSGLRGTGFRGQLAAASQDRPMTVAVGGAGRATQLSLAL
jgi:phosphoribosyl 1,2-cyclic phosphodiesterase